MFYTIPDKLRDMYKIVVLLLHRSRIKIIKLIFLYRFTMKPLKTLLFFCALLSCLLLCGTSTSGNDRRWLDSLVDLMELDYVDYCEKRADANWNELVGDPRGLSVKVSYLQCNLSSKLLSIIKKML